MTTVVSAYYKMQSKCGHDVYMKWINNYMHLKCNMVFYTDEETVTDLRESVQSSGKSNIIFKIVPKTDWVAYHKYGKDFWDHQKSIDTDNTPSGPMHSPDLYCVWYEKKHFVLRTIDENPYNSTYFIWCDAGAVRDIAWLSNIDTFGCSTENKNMPKDKIVLLNIKPYSEYDMAYFNDTGVMPSNKDLIGGGIQGAYRHIWPLWSDLYDKKLDEMHTCGRFVGKDQDILNILVITEKAHVGVIPSYMYITPDPWFLLLYVF
jgi:hypothetical protein